MGQYPLMRPMIDRHYPGRHCLILLVVVCCCHCLKSRPRYPFANSFRWFLSFVSVARRPVLLLLLLSALVDFPVFSCPIILSFWVSFLGRPVVSSCLNIGCWGAVGFSMSKKGRHGPDLRADL